MRKVMLCSSVRPGELPPIFGSKQDSCYVCLQPVWVAASSDSIEVDFRVCYTCLIKLDKEIEKIAEFTEEQLQEIRENFKNV